MKKKIFAVFIGLITFLFLNVVALFFQPAPKRPSNPLIARYGRATVEKAHPELSKEELNDLLNETSGMQYTHEPFTQVKELPCTGKYVNVDNHGFRVTKNQGPWPPDPNNLNVFLFGGSTIFGYGISDDHTIASYLQEFLNSGSQKNFRVYNFGRGAYYSTQELILFERLLTSGFIPNMAVFIDGVNEFFYFYNPILSEYFAKSLEPTEDSANPNRRSSSDLLLALLKRLPVVKFINSLKNKSMQKSLNIGEKQYNDEAAIKRVLNGYVENKKLIEAVSAAYDVKPIFVWQPVPTYKYDLHYHLFASGFTDMSDKRFENFLITRYEYPLMEEFIKKKPLGNNFLWCADIQQYMKEPLYVDRLHYNPKMNKMLAHTIYDLLIKRNLLNLK